MKKSKYETSAKAYPPRWADTFLQWYCRPDLLEEIQGDAYELYYRQAKQNKRRADFSFCWNVLRFFRLKNIRKRKTDFNESHLTPAMIKNILIVSLRNFVRQPGHTLLNVFGLSVGFCSAFIILLWVNHEMSFDRFHKEPEAIFKVLTHIRTEGNQQTFDLASAGIDISSIPEAESLVTVSEGTRWPHELCFRAESKGNECVYIKGIYADPKLFDIFNFPITEGDPDPLKGEYQIAISQSMAGKLFGSENAIGKNLKIDGFIEVIVASVFKNNPANSSLQFDYVMSYSMLKKLWGINEENLRSNFFSVYLKTRPGTTAETLTTKLNDKRVLTEELQNEKLRYQAYPFTDWRLKNKFENGQLTGGRIDYVNLFIIVGALVLLLAIINYVNLSTARATTRAKEIGVRKVIGAVKGSIVFQFLGESFLLVVLSFSMAVLLIQLSVPVFEQLIGESLHINWFTGMTPIYMVAILIVVTIASGLYPAFVVSSFQPLKILKKQVSMKGTGSERIRKALLLVQLTVALAIINFSGVMYHQLKFINDKNIGFEHSNTLRIEPTFGILKQFDAFKNEIRKESSILSVATSNLNPIGSSGHNITVNWPGKSPDQRITFQTIGCSYEFPETIGLKIIEGQNFQQKPIDSLRTEVLVTQDAVNTMNLKDPVGAQFTIGDRQCVIIGVVNDFHTESLHHTRLPVILYRIPYTQSSAIYVKYEGGATDKAVSASTSAYKSLEDSFTMKYWFQDETFNDLYKTEQVASRIILLFTVIALVIAILGVAGLSTYNVMRKTREISIRRVMGATSGNVLTLLTKEFGFVMIIALVLTTPLAFLAAQQWLSGFTYHTPVPWTLFPVSFAIMALITIAIIILQGWKTITSNPAENLRME